jgi:hypothetical protein
VLSLIRVVRTFQKRDEYTIIKMICGVVCLLHLHNSLQHLGLMRGSEKLGGGGRIIISQSELRNLSSSKFTPFCSHLPNSGYDHT